MRIRSFLCRLVCCLLLLAAIGCSPKVTPPVSQTVTPEQERAFSTVAEQAVLGFAYLSPDRKAAIRVENAAGRLSTSAGTQYMARAVMLKPAIAAVPVPLDRVVISEEMLLALPTDALLTAALAHQMGHLAAGHPLQKLEHAEVAKGRTGKMLLANWSPGAESPEQRVELSQLAGRLLDLHYSLEEENQANVRATDMLGKAGYPPSTSEGMLDALVKYGAKVKRTPEYFTMHPLK